MWQEPYVSGLVKHKKKTKRAAPVSKEESWYGDADYSDQGSDNEFWLSTPSEEDPYDVIIPSPASWFIVGDLTVVKVERKLKNSFRLYITEVIVVEADGYVGILKIQKQ